MTSEDVIRERTNQWVESWSPGDQPWTGAGLRELFAQGEGGIHVVDDFEGGAVVLSSIDAYIDHWTPVIAGFRHWSIELVAPATIRVDGDLAVTTFQFRARGELADGTALTPAPGQHGTHIWERSGGEWRLVHEHLTNV